MLNLCRDPKKRLTAREALKHPWLHGGTTADRGEGAPLNKTVVQRIQVPGTSLTYESNLCRDTAWTGAMQHPFVRHLDSVVLQVHTTFLSLQHIVLMT